MLEKKGNPSKLLGKVKANGSISHTQAINEKLTEKTPRETKYETKSGTKYVLK